MVKRQVLLGGARACSWCALFLLWGCLGDDARSQDAVATGDPVGSVRLELDMAGGMAAIEEVSYTITNDQEMLRSGTIALDSGANAPAAAVIESVPAGRIAVAMTGMTRNGLRCDGRSGTTVSGGRTSSLAVWLQCIRGRDDMDASTCENPGTGNEAGSGGSAGASAGAGGTAGAGGSAGAHAGSGGSAGASAGAGGSAGSDAGADAGMSTDAGTDAGASTDAGTDAGASEPSLCDTPADACDGCACASCAQQVDACERADGVAQAGPAAGTSLAALCLDLVSCSARTGCEGLQCYCGPGVDLGSCLAGGAFGACRDEMTAAAETTTPTGVVSRQGNSRYALGLASALMTCKSAECAAQCN